MKRKITQHNEQLAAREADRLARHARLQELVETSGPPSVVQAVGLVNSAGIRLSDVRPGDLWWVDFPFEGEISSKIRPALIVRSPQNGLVHALYVTSQNHVGARHGTYQLLPRTISGLGKESYVRLDRGYLIDVERIVKFDTRCDPIVVDWVLRQVRTAPFVDAHSGGQRSGSSPVAKAKQPAAEEYAKALGGAALVLHAETIAACDQPERFPVVRGYTRALEMHEFAVVLKAEFDERKRRGSLITASGGVALPIPPWDSMLDIQAIFEGLGLAAGVVSIAFGMSDGPPPAHLGLPAVKVPKQVLTHICFPEQEIAATLCSMWDDTEDRFVYRGLGKINPTGTWLCQALGYSPQ